MMKTCMLGLFIAAATPAWAIIWLNDPSPESLKAQIHYKRTMILEPSALIKVPVENRFKQLQEVGMNYLRLLDIIRYSNPRTSPLYTAKNAWWDIGILTKYQGAPESLAMDTRIRAWARNQVLSILKCEALLAGDDIAKPPEAP